MNRRFLAALACVCVLTCRASADVPLGNSKVHFASQSEGRQILTAKDEFIQRLSPFDRSARMKTDKAISENELLAFIGRSVEEWTKDETQTLQATIEALQPLLRDLRLSLPPAIQLIKTTGADHFIRLTVDGHESLAMPILLSRVETYDVKRGGEFFAYLEFQFLVVEKDGRSGNLKPVIEDSSPRLVGMERVSGFMEQVGKNTDYIIHPEEILADNFALLVLNAPKVASPEILQKMREVLLRKTVP